MEGRARRERDPSHRLHGDRVDDNVVQGLATAKRAPQQGDEEAALAELDRTLDESQYIISDLLGPDEKGLMVQPGDLRREQAAGDAS